MQAALDEAGKALAAGEFPVGCVMVHHGDILARGHRINSIPPSENELDHAEIIALRSLCEHHPELGRQEVIVYSTMEPCLMCYVTLLLNGFRKIVYGFEDVMGGGTSLDLQHLNPLYRDMNIEITIDVLRQESLELFRTFFEIPENTYWQGSFLEQYVMAQSMEDNEN
jgi:tRNA(adenine34) deaminase